MKLNPTETGAMILADITDRLNRNRVASMEAYQASNCNALTSGFVLGRVVTTAAYDEKMPTIRANSGSPFKAKSWQNKLWKQFYRHNPIMPYSTCYTTPDGRMIESVVIRYFVIRHIYNDDTGVKLGRLKVVNESKLCKTYSSMVDTILTLVRDVGRLTPKIENDPQAATYTMTFRTLVRYSDGSFDSTPTSFQDLLDILGLALVNDNGVYEVIQNPDVMWFPMQRVVRGEYK